MCYCNQLSSTDLGDYLEAKDLQPVKISLHLRMPQTSAHLIISGCVQGVAYRASTEREVLRRRLTGWVRNLADGNVEAVFEGPKEVVEDMVRWCHQGPPASRVTQVEVTWKSFTGEFEGFSITPTSLL